MTKKRDWQFGEWCEFLGERCRVFYAAGPNVRIIDIDGVEKSLTTTDPERLTYLPDCTGWDWQPPPPIDPGEGWRFLDKSELVEKGDEYFCRSVWAQSLNWMRPGRKQAELTYTYRRRITPQEPKYRPFANEDEYIPHRDKWLRIKGCGRKYQCIVHDDMTILLHTYCASWDRAFEDLEFDDGTPFGVLCE